MKIMKLLVPILLILIISSCSGPRSGQKDIRGDELAYISRMTKAAPKIVIDAGHGGKDLGALSKTVNKIQEKNLNLNTALILNKMLQKMGYETILTRGGDFSVPLDLRANLANSNQAALFVSIHYNAALNTKAEGVEIFYYNDEKDKNRMEESKQLAALVLDSITKNIDMKSRGVKKANLAVIRETKMPAILIEGGFVTNDLELGKLIDPEFQRRMSFSIAKAIHEYLKR